MANKTYQPISLRDKTKCPKCQQNDAEATHPCPYKYDIENDDTPCCTCCSACTKECADDI